MHRVLVALLAAFDAVIAAAAALAAVLAPLTVLWVFGIARPDWGALWPAGASVWQLGNLVPLPITLPQEYLVATGIGDDAASFTLSLAPLAFAAFTVIFAARSGARAAGASAWATGVLSGSVVFAAAATAVALTSRNDVAHPRLWQAVVIPAALYAGAALIGAIVAAWRDGDGGLIDRLHARADAAGGDWPAVPGLAVRGAAAALAGLIGLGGLVVAFALVARGGQVIALFEATRVDALGATLVTLAQLMYLPTLVVWGMSWIAGPGFSLGAGTAVSPAGTQLGVVPGVPVLGVIPESLSPWLLLVLLLPVGVGALAGWIVRSRLHRRRLGRAVGAMDADEPAGPRVVLALVIAVLSGAGAGLLALAASGSLGPGRLAQVGPAAGPVSLAVGLEVLVGAAILLLSPRRAEPSPAGSRSEDAEPAGRALGHSRPDPRGASGRESPQGDVAAEGDPDDAHDEPWEPGGPPAGAGGRRDDPPDPAGLGAGRPVPLPPVE